MGSDDEGEDEEVPVGSSRKRSPTARLQIHEEEDQNFPLPDDSTEEEDGDGADEDEDLDDFSLSKSLGALGDIEVPKRKHPQSARKRSRRESSDEDDDTPLEIPESVWENGVIQRWVDGEKKGWNSLQCGLFIEEQIMQQKSKPIWPEQKGKMFEFVPPLFLIELGDVQTTMGKC